MPLPLPLALLLAMTAATATLAQASGRGDVHLSTTAMGAPAISAWRLWTSLRRAQAELEGFVDEFPLTKAALVQVLNALKQELPASKGVKRRRSLEERRAMRTSTQKLRRLHLKCSLLRSQVEAATGAKGLRRQLSVDWLVRVALAAPLVSARSLTTAFMDVCDVDQQIVCRATVGRIKDAFVEVVKTMMFKYAAGTVSASNECAAATGASFQNILLTHIQDEAALRLRSFSDASHGVTPRVRASKVQQYVVRLFACGVESVIPTELEALGNKTAATLATSFERLLRDLALAIFPAVSRKLCPVWFVHVIVGDGFPTNEAAAKLLWSMMQRDPLGSSVRYFLVVLKCAAHQANLSCKSAVCGPAAKISEHDGGVGDPPGVHDAVCGVVVSLFKYLLSDYYEELCCSTREWVLRDLEVVGSHMALAAAKERALGMATLYGRHVFPCDVMRLWNNGFENMQHVVADGLVPEQERPRIVGEFVSVLIQCLMQVDEHPTLTRFWTFREAVGRMLAMSILAFPRNALRLKSVVPRALNQARLRRVLSFFANPATPQYLRRTCLTLQLTGAVTSLTGTKDKSGAQSPMVVRLLHGEAHDMVQTRLSDIIGNMCDDPLLDAGAATGAVLATAIDLVIRMDQFRRYPCKLAAMCRRWNPHTYLTNILDFLKEPRENLDIGYSAQLQSLAREQDTNMKSIAYLASPSVQEALELLFTRATVTSLDVERWHAQAKRWEASKLTHVANASRNVFLQRYLRERHEDSVTCHKAGEKVRKAKYLNTQSILWQAQPQARPPGERWAQSQAPARRESASMPGSVLAANVPDMCEEAESRKEGARDVLLKFHARHGMPVTRFQWRLWMSEHEEEFRGMMKTASAERKQRSRRLTAREDLPKPIPRLQPLALRYEPSVA